MALKGWLVWLNGQKKTHSIALWELNCNQTFRSYSAASWFELGPDSSFKQFCGHKDVRLDLFLLLHVSVETSFVARNILHRFVHTGESSSSSSSSSSNPLTARIVGAPQMILQPVFSIFPCSPLPSGTWRTPGLSILWCCLPTSSSVCLVFFPLSLCLARWFWPDLMNGRHDHTTAVCVV